uniref:Uncharacterized protein n=1 Tax=Acrobeloides nanus TaxID=290746 RepID=A0A914BXK2_9BILA
MIGAKSIQVTNRLANVMSQSMAVRLQSSTGTTSLNPNQQKRPPVAKIGGLYPNPPLPKDVERKSEDKHGRLEFTVEPMGEDLAVVLKPSAELKETKVDLQEERSSKFENADYMEKGSDFKEEDLKGGFEEGKESYVKDYCKKD